MKRLFTLALTIGLLLCTALASLPVSAAKGPDITDDFEQAAPSAGVAGLTGTKFAYINSGSIVSSIASKEDPVQRAYVIDGMKSLHYQNDAGFYHYAITNPEEGGFPMVSGKVYAVNFLLKFHEAIPSDTIFTFYARTWIDVDEANGWPAFDFKSVGGKFTLDKVRNGKMFDKADVRELEKDLYSVSVRFQTTTASNPSYPNWFFAFGVNGKVNLSMDNFHMWNDASSVEPADIHSTFGTGGITTKSVATVTTASKLTTTTSKAKTTVRTQTLPSNSKTVQSVITTESSEATTYGSENTTIASGGITQTTTGGVTDEDSEDGMPLYAIILLIVAIVVVLGGGGMLAFVLIRSKKTV